MVATYKKYILDFKRPSGTSRGVLRTKETWFLILTKDGNTGIGECGVLRTLSIDDRPDYEDKLKWVCANISLGKKKLWEALLAYPSIQFGIEMAFKSLESTQPFLLFPSKFTKHQDPIPINGLIWMGDKSFMKNQIKEKLEQGFTCIKLKIGAIDFENELALLRYIRKHYSSDTIEIRVDANGAFDPSKAQKQLEQLSQFDLHSIEQPIKAGQLESMYDLCKNSPLPIALDEELIGIFTLEEKRNLLNSIQPQYIILKPSLIGGFRGTQEWIDLANQLKIDWWITSALESNIGLNAIAQYTYTLQSKLPQGLGTGALYTNNFKAPLTVTQGKLYYNTQVKWEVSYLNN
ncbi:o-succinylbenzoate synthase [Aquimarina sp. W85]|uniref:o-succinylbenzoate synthase n=1 Tax=Aquimarina rhodophyticola TaxID=3342246 RepID=UPI00366D9EA7